MLNNQAALYGGGVIEVGDFESIATASGTGSSGTITFSSIPSTYKHLQIRYIGRGTGSGVATQLRMRINGSSSPYAFHRLLGNGSAASAFGYAGEVYIQDVISFAGGGAGSYTFGAGVIEILDYSNSNKNAVVRALSGTDNNGAGEIILGSGLYPTAAVITEVSLEANGQNWATGSHFALYGIKG